jgi:hypothetical protein
MKTLTTGRSNHLNPEIWNIRFKKKLLFQHSFQNIERNTFVRSGQRYWVNIHSNIENSHLVKNHINTKLLQRLWQNWKNMGSPQNWIYSKVQWPFEQQESVGTLMQSSKLGKISIFCWMRLKTFLHYVISLLLFVRDLIKLLSRSVPVQQVESHILHNQSFFVSIFSMKVHSVKFTNTHTHIHTLTHSLTQSVHYFAFVFVCVCVCVSLGFENHARWYGMWYYKN